MTDDHGTSSSRQPSAVFGRLIAGISAGRWGELADLYAPDAVVRQPFAPPGGPASATIEGHEQLRTHFAQAAQLPFELTARNVVVHETGDPEVVIAEFDYDIHVLATGAHASASNIQVLRIRDGLITATRDYHDHRALAAALG